jgi:chromosomal replication initiator protein
MARQVAMYVSRKMTGASFPDIGKKMGGRDHSTVIHACNKIKNILDQDMKLKRFIDEFEEALVNETY